MAIAPEPRQTFKVGDKWQVRWHSTFNLNVSVIAEDGTVVAGASAMHGGALYVPKGGTYHLQVECVLPRE